MKRNSHLFFGTCLAFSLPMKTNIFFKSNRKCIPFISIVTFSLLTGLGSTGFGKIIGKVKTVTLEKITGWACDTNVQASIALHVYSEDATGKTVPVTAGSTSLESDTEVHAKCGTQASIMHNFEIPLTQTHLAQFGGTLLNVHGISKSGGANFQIEEEEPFRFPKVNVNVRGFIDRIDEIETGVRITGWACQTNYPVSIRVELFTSPDAAAQPVASTMANLKSEPGIHTLCLTQYEKQMHRFALDLTKDQAAALVNQKIYLKGVSQIKGTSDGLLYNSGNFVVPPISRKLSEFIQSNEVNIPEGAVAIIDGNYDLGEIMIAGKLKCPDKGDFQIKTTGIHIAGKNAVFECGTSEKRFAGRLRIGLKQDKSMVGYERSLMVMSGGSLQLFGSTKNSQWLRLAKTAEAGQREIHLSAPVTWSVGDQIVIGPSNYDYQEAEEHEVEAILNKGNVVRLAKPLKYRHWGAVQEISGRRKWILDERAEVANLNRNILIYADGVESEMDYKGGHVMVMRGASAYVDSVEFYLMGRMGEMARYPFHWHRVGDAPGQFIVNSSIHHSFQRCVTVHGTNRTLVKNNVCFNHFGHGFFLEDGDEVENRIEGNLGILSKKPLKNRHLLQSDIDESSPDRFPGPSTFWISNPKNYISGNVASGSQGTGFWMSFVPALYCEPKFCRIPDAKNPQVTMRPSSMETLEFNSNIAHSSQVGMNWDGAAFGAPTNNPNNLEDRSLSIVNYNPPKIPVFKNLTFFKNRNAAIYFRGTTATFSESILADNRVGFFFAYNQVVQDALVMAMSQNHVATDFKANPEFSGVRIYDGPFDLRKIDFVNFPSQPIDYAGKKIIPTPIMDYGGANRYTNAVSGLKFFPEPVRRIFFTTDSNGWADSVSSPSVRDVDGSLSGKSGSLVLPDWGFNQDPSCTKIQVSQGLSCQYQRGLIFFGAVRIDKATGQSKDETSYTPFVVKRSDGPETLPLSVVATKIFNNKFGVVLDRQFQYDVSFPTTWSIPEKFEVRFQAENVQQVSPVILLKNIGKNCSLNKARLVGSLEQLKQSTDNAYFVQNQNLFFKLIATKPAWMGKSEFSHSGESDTLQVVCNP